jgi:drug/metabolite transporter (DMT)-like permease
MIAIIVSLPGGIKLPPDAGVWGIVAVTAIFATAIAFLVQTWAQSLVPAVSAAIIMTMEPVFAGIFGVFIGGNKLTLQIISGAVCVLAAMLMVALKSASKTARLEN